MFQHVEARVTKGSGRHKKELHHLRVGAHEDATPENPAWVVEHHYASPDHEPEAHEFSDHEEMLEHVRRHSGVEPVAEEEGENG